MHGTCPICHGPPLCPPNSGELWIGAFRPPNRTNPIVQGLGAWAAHFRGAPLDRYVDRYSCYDPRDLQLRAATCAAAFDPQKGRFASHRFHATSTGPDAFNKALSLLTRDNVVVGVTELYAATSCMVFYKFDGRIPTRCRSLCSASRPQALQNATLQTLHKAGAAGAFVHSHGDSSRLKDGGYAPAAILKDIDYITRADTILYSEMLKRVLAAMLDVERRVGGGFRLLCPNDLLHLKREIRHLPTLVMEVEALVGAERFQADMLSLALGS